MSPPGAMGIPNYMQRQFRSGSGAVPLSALLWILMAEATLTNPQLPRFLPAASPSEVNGDFCQDQVFGEIRR